MLSKFFSRAVLGLLFLGAGLPAPAQEPVYRFGFQPSELEGVDLFAEVSQSWLAPAESDEPPLFTLEWSAGLKRDTDKTEINESQAARTAGRDSWTASLSPAQAALNFSFLHASLGLSFVTDWTRQFDDTRQTLIDPFTSRDRRQTFLLLPTADFGLKLFCLREKSAEWSFDLASAWAPWLWLSFTQDFQVDQLAQNDHLARIWDCRDSWSVTVGTSVKTLHARLGTSLSLTYLPLRYDYLTTVGVVHRQTPISDGKFAFNLDLTSLKVFGSYPLFQYEFYFGQETRSEVYFGFGF